MNDTTLFRVLEVILRIAELILSRVASEKGAE